MDVSEKEGESFLGGGGGDLVSLGVFVFDEND